MVTDKKNLQKKFTIRGGWLELNFVEKYIFNSNKK